MCHAVLALLNAVNERAKNDFQLYFTVRTYLSEKIAKCRWFFFFKEKVTPNQEFFFFLFALASVSAPFRFTKIE